MPIDANLKVLIVDDSDAMRKVLKSALEKLGLTNVQEAKEGLRAWQMLQENGRNRSPFKIVITCPDLELVKNLRSDALLKRVPILMVVGQDTNVAEAIRAGVTDVIARPFGLNLLEEKLTKMLS